jgi:phosphotransferase system enzyme I (PtsI)
MASARADIPQDTLLVGIGTSPGVAIGESFLLHRARMCAIAVPIAADAVDAEVSRFLTAIERSKEQLNDVRSGVTDPRLLEHLYIIDTHLLILEDAALVDDTVKVIRAEQTNAEGALQKTIHRFRSIFDDIEDEYLRERCADIEAIGDRILYNLSGEERPSLKSIDREVIIVAHDLSPADTMQIDRSRIIAFVTDVGGRTSHTSILARSLGVPAIVGLESATMHVPGGVPLIVDGTSGTLILNPSAATYREYREKQKAFELQEHELLGFRDLKAETRDGHRIHLRCNIETPQDLDGALSQAAEGVGLLRSEFLFMGRETSPDEDEQYQAYTEVITSMAPEPVTIRTLDVGGDKFVPEINLLDEANPVMGLRAVRFSLKERTLFHTQLRAILRASAHGAVQIMFPMITGVAEVRECRHCVEAARLELAAEGVPMAAHVPLGVMIETPSAALIADLLAVEVDFFSIGTNDLIQYCLAVDRGNEHVAYLYEPLHPAVLRALKAVCDAAQKRGIPVSMCGEMAGDPIYTPILLGLGLRELSMSPHGIPRVKQILRQLTLADGERCLATMLTMPTATEVARWLENEMARLFPKQF